MHAVRSVRLSGDFKGLGVINVFIGGEVVGARLNKSVMFLTLHSRFMDVQNIN